MPVALPWQTADSLQSVMHSRSFSSPICVQEARVSVTTKQKCLSLARSLAKSSAVARSLSPHEAADLPQVQLLLSAWYSQDGHGTET